MKANNSSTTLSRKYKKLVNQGKELLLTPAEYIIREEWNDWFGVIQTMADHGKIHEFWDYAQKILTEEEQKIFGFTLHEYLMEPTPKDLHKKKGSLILIPVLMSKKSCLRWGDEEDIQEIKQKICNFFRKQGWLMDANAHERVFPSSSIWKNKSWLGINLLSKYRLRSLEGRWQYLEDAIEQVDLESEARDILQTHEDEWLSGVLPVYVHWNKREWVERMERRARPNEEMSWGSLLKKEDLWMGEPGLFVADALIVSTASVLKHLANQRGYQEATWSPEMIEEEGEDLKLTYGLEYKKINQQHQLETWRGRASFWIDGLLENQMGPDGLERILSLLNQQTILIK